MTGLYYLSDNVYTVFKRYARFYILKQSRIETKKLFALFFADDLVIFAETVVELQRMINRLLEYCDIWHLTINLVKTKVIVFRNGGPLRQYES